jgi:hypothetical protein
MVTLVVWRTTNGYLPTQAVADFLATGAVPTIDGILFPSVQAEEKDALNIVLFQKAAKVAILDIPKGTKIEGSDGHWSDDGWETDYTVWETLPSVQKKAAQNDLNSIDNGPLVGHSFEIMDEDERVPALRIDTSKITVHAVQKVKFKTYSHGVTRHRMDDRPTVF